MTQLPEPLIQAEKLVFDYYETLEDKNSDDAKICLGILRNFQDVEKCDRCNCMIIPNIMRGDEYNKDAR